jgi:predicted ester cyclase
MRRRSLLAAATVGLGVPGISAPIAAPVAAGAEPGPAGVAAAFAATLSAHDIAAFAALFAEEYAQHQFSAAVPPRPAGSGSAKQGTIAYFTARLTALPDLQVTAEPVVAAGDMVAANFTYAGTHTAPYFGVAPSGRRVTFNSCDILTVRDGLIVAHWGAADIAGLLVQLRG